MAKQRVLVVDDEQGMLEVCDDVLAALPDTEVFLELSSIRALERLKEDSFDLLITDLNMPELGGIELLRAAREIDPDLTALMITAYPGIETAVAAMKLGAADYLTKPFLPDDLRETVRRLLADDLVRNENRLLRRHVERGDSFEEIIGTSATIEAIFDTIARVADTEADVLITGETGVGKELVACCIHKRSARRKQRFVPIDCASIPDNLLESEFFGHERGAFTGADHRTMGLLEFADGGTVFLDEIGELPLTLQAKLLRALQERSFRAVGATKETTVNVRVLVATRRDLAADMRAGTFRDDLYYRINVVRIEVPPLRERRTDIPALIDYFFDRCAGEMNRPTPTIDEEALDILCRAQWPGNVRELQNIVKRMAALIDGSVISVDDLPDDVVVQAGENNGGDLDGFFSLRSQRLASFEREYFTNLLRTAEGDVSKAAQQARVPRGTLYRLLHKHGISPESFRKERH